MSWVEDNLKERLRALPDLLHCVRFPLLSSSELQEALSCSLLCRSSGARGSLEVLRSLVRGNYKGPECRPRTPNQVLTGTTFKLYTSQENKTCKSTLEGSIGYRRHGQPPMSSGKKHLKIFLGAFVPLLTGQLKSRQETGERERERHAAKGHRWNRTRVCCARTQPPPTEPQCTPIYLFF